MPPAGQEPFLEKVPGRRRHLTLQEIDFVDVEGFPFTINGQNNGQSNRRLGRRYRHDKKYDQLPVQGLILPGKRNKCKIHGIQHQLDAHEDHDGTAPDKYPDYSQGKKYSRQYQTMTYRDHLSPPCLELLFADQYHPDDSD